MKLPIGNLILGAFALGFSLAAGELVMRSVVTMPVRRVLPEVRYAPHPVRRFTLLPEQRAHSYGVPAAIDARGFRSDGHGHTGTGERLLALGDSFTFGLGVEDHETWPARLEQSLRNGTPDDIEVVNSGTISYGVFQELDLLETAGVALRPQLVIHGLYWNDFMNASAPPPGARPVVDANGYLVWDQLGGPGGLRRMASTALSSSALLYSVRKAAAGWRKDSRPQSDYGAAYDKLLKEGLAEAEWATLEGFYRDLQRLGRENRFGVVVVIMPVVDIAISPAADRHPYRLEARRRLEQLGIPYVDGFAAINSPTMFLPQGPDAHLNAEGYRLVAEALAPTVRQARLSAAAATH